MSLLTSTRRPSRSLKVVWLVRYSRRHSIGSARLPQYLRTKALSNTTKAIDSHLINSARLLRYLETRALIVASEVINSEVNGRRKEGVPFVHFNLHTSEAGYKAFNCARLSSIGGHA
ncbi:hypothetical protein AMTR_s00034p00127720 [Amborella trichopoda]|uniref:Uncharacterized protein n=1 Tax=Amborella trichopoda TaxID=13333 RepID=W1PWF8_AMBTC|nr:hypothetical protein AMTR_s00034p00127720 [Amborella trichopoda]